MGYLIKCLAVGGNDACRQAGQYLRGWDTTAGGGMGASVWTPEMALGQPYPSPATALAAWHAASAMVPLRAELRVPWAIEVVAGGGQYTMVPYDMSRDQWYVAEITEGHPHSPYPHAGEAFLTEVQAQALADRLNRDYLQEREFWDAQQRTEQ
jgi:hypothetical protein